MSRRKPRFRLWIWLSLLALIAALAFGTRYSHEPLASRRLPDGSTLRIETMTFGGKHRYAPGGAMRQLFSLAIPENVSVPTAIRSFSRTEPDPNTPVLWVTHPGRPASQQAALFGGPNAEWAVIDTRGSERLITGDWMRYAPNNAYQVSSIGLRTYPRRSPWIRLRRYNDRFGAGRKSVADFAVRNPYPGPYPQWKAEPPPCVVKEPDLECRLLAFRNGVATTPRSWQGWSPTFDAATEIDIAVRTAPEAERWRAVDVAYIDATGNVYDRHRYGFTRPAGQATRLHWSGVLPYDEDAWKVRVELARTAASRFRPAELWTVSGIPVPDWGKTSDLWSHTATLDGVKMRLRSLERATPSKLSVFLETDLPGHELTLVRLVDDRGREVLRRPEWNFPNRTTLGWSTYEFAFDIRGGAKTLTATLAFHKTRFVEFLAKPTHLIPPPQPRVAAR